MVVIDETLLDAMEKMDKAVEHVQNDFATVRTGRAAGAARAAARRLLRRPVPLQQLASIQVPEARSLVVKPHERGALAPIEKAIRDSDLGVSPNNDGVVIRLNFPPLTEERREYVKVVKHMAEDAASRSVTSGVTPASTSRAPRKAASSRDDLDRAEKGSRKSPTTTSSGSTRRSAARNPNCSSSGPTAQGDTGAGHGTGERTRHERRHVA